MNEYARMSEDRLIRTHGNRRIACLERGKRDGTPVLFFHGTPGSRCFCHPDESIAHEAGARIIHFDRPGYGSSDRQPRRTLLDCVKDVADLVDAFEIKKFFVVGVSGGAPHALACANSMPNRVLGAALVSSMAPLDQAQDALKEMNAMNRMGLWVARRMPIVLPPLLGPMAKKAQSDPEALLDQVAPNYSQPDRQAMSEPSIRRMYVEDIAASYRQGAAGHADDLRAVAGPWGFEPGEIKVPVQLWHGEEDTNVPIAMSESLASDIPGARFEPVPGQGHLLMFSNWRQILGGLL